MCIEDLDFICNGSLSPICPYCGNIKSEKGVIADCEINCSRCGRSFVVKVRKSYKYFTTKKDM